MLRLPPYQPTQLEEMECYLLTLPEHVLGTRLSAELYVSLEVLREEQLKAEPQ